MIEVHQIIYALRRAEFRLQAQADVLHDAHDYSAEFPAADAERMREAIALLEASGPVVKAAAVAQPSAEPADMMHFFEHEFETGSSLDLATQAWQKGHGTKMLDTVIKDLMRRYAALVLDAIPPAGADEPTKPSAQPLKVISAWRYRGEHDSWFYVDGQTKPTWHWKKPECQALVVASDNVVEYNVTFGSKLIACLNEARCLSKRTVGNAELAGRIMRLFEEWQ